MCAVYLEKDCVCVGGGGRGGSVRDGRNEARRNDDIYVFYKSQVKP